MLRAVGLDVQRVTYIDEIGKDMVYYIKFKGKEVKPGDRIPKTSKLELVCGNGGEDENCLKLMFQNLQNQNLPINGFSRITRTTF